MSNRTSLVLDARKAYDSGIGTYIRNLIPFLKEEFDLRVIGDRAKMEVFGSPVLHLEASTYSLADVYKPSLLAGACDIFWTPHFNFPLWPVKAKLKVSTVYDLYHLAHWELLSIPQKVYYKLFMDNLVRSADVIFTISEFTKDSIQESYPKALPKTHVITLGVDFDRFHITTDDSRLQEVKNKYSLPSRFVLFVGNLKPNKNVMALLQAYNLILSENTTIDWQVVVVGKKEGFKIGDNEAIDYIYEKGLQEKVHFTGFVEEVDLPVMYQLATLFAFPSLYEGFGLPPLEAIACGCPVACSDAASLPEVCQEHVHYFDGRNIENVKTMINKLMSDDQVRLSKVKEACSWVKRYDWGLTAERHIKILKDEFAKSR